MGITAVVHSGSSSVASLSLLSQVGLGVGGIFVTTLLVYLLAYLKIIEASSRSKQYLRQLLVGTSVPLLVAFAGIIAFESLSIIGVL